MNETEFYAALTLIAASAASALAAGYLETRRASMLKATLVLMMISAFLAMAGPTNSNAQTEAPDASRTIAVPAATTPPVETPDTHRSRTPPRRCSMVAYLSV